MVAEVEDVAQGMDIDTEPGPSAADKGKAPVSNGTDDSGKNQGIPWVRSKPFLVSQTALMIGPSGLMQECVGTTSVHVHL